MRTPQLRGLSPSTLELVKKLYRKGNLFERWNGDDDIIAILERLGEANEPAAIRDLMPFGLIHNERIRAEARSIIRHLFTQVSIEALPLLDESLRQSWANLEDWYGLRPDAVDSFSLKTDSDRIFLGLVTSHRSGYVRAAALRALESESSDDIIPFVLIRLVDWVGEVRSVAESTLQTKLRPEYSKAFVGCLGLFDRLTTNSRFRVAYSQWIDGLLTSPECAAALRDGMRAPSRGIRRHCYKVAVENPALHVKDVITQAVNDTDVIVRKWAFLTGPRLLPEIEDALRLQAARDPYAPIRRIAFEALTANLPASLEDVMPFLLDRSVALRRECQAIVLAETGTSAADFYRARIHNRQDANTHIVVLGLAETGATGDIHTVAALLGSRSARVRRAVVRGLHILGSEGQKDALLGVVSSDVPSVAREAAFVILSGRTVPAEEVWAATLASDTETALRLLEPLRQRLPAPLVHQLDFILQTAIQ